MSLLGYQLYWIPHVSTCETLLYQPHILYKRWEDVLEAAAYMAADKAETSYIQVLNKVDDVTQADCHQFKNAMLYILVDVREPHEKYGAIWVCPVHEPKN